MQRRPGTRLARRLLRRLLLRLLFELVQGLGALQRRYRPAPALPPDQDRIRHILVIRLDLLGDLVMTLPAIVALRARWPAARIAVLCTPAAREIAARCSAIDEVYTYDPRQVRTLRWWRKPSSFRDLFRLVRRLRAARFDLALSMHGEFACLFAWAGGARHRVGYAGEGYPALLTLPVPGRRYRQPRGHEVHWNEHLAAVAGAPSLQTPPHLPFPQDQQAWLDTFLQPEGVGPQGYVVLSPGAHNGSAKRYLLESWAAVANDLARTRRVRVVLSGAPNDVPLVAELAALLETPPIIAAGRTELPQLLALLGGARLLLAGDSGPVHLAAALGTPVVAVFGPTDPSVYRPFTDRATVLRTALACSPCYDLSRTAECRLGYPVPLCMVLLPVRRVVSAAQCWLDATAGADLPGRRCGPPEAALDMVR